MLTRVVCTFAPLLIGLSPISAQRTSDRTQTLRRISASVMQGESMELLRQLTDDIGARLAGSPAHERATQWAAGKFRDAGLTNVRLEEFTMPNGWQRGPARARIVAPAVRPLRVGSVGWGPSTPSGGVRGDLILISDVSRSALRSQSAQLKNRIVLVDFEKAVPPDHPLAFAHLRDSYALFSDLGVQAVLLPHNVPNNVPGFVDTGNARGTILPIPVGEIGWEDYLLLRRHLTRGPVTIEVEWQNETSGPTPVSNVIAEIAGSELPHEWVLLGAHLDSWDLGTGAQDNGTGVVMVLEAARAIAALGQAPRRSIRFALWAAEEPGPPGSAMFIKRHATELRDCVAALNTDYGAGRPRGWHVLGRDDLRDAMRPIAERLREFGADGLSMDANCGSDECPFLLEGIPALKFWVDTDHYREVHHKPSDTFDKVDSALLRAGGAVVAMTTYAIADQPTRIAPHIGQDAVRRILRTAKLDVDLMNALWKP
jgi:carboxypeptidase Q